MRNLLLILAALALLGLPSPAAERSFQSFAIATADIVKSTTTRGNPNDTLNITLTPAKAKELLAFTGKNLGHEVVICWIRDNPSTHSQFIDITAYFVKQIIRNGILQINVPNQKSRLRFEFAGA